MFNRYLEKYRADFDKIEGWCSTGLFDVLDALDRLAFSRAGGALEIGVHHGKFLILLNQLIEGQESSYAVDVFDDQRLNIDHSGRGQIDIFQDNLRKYDRHHGENVKIISGDSTDAALRLRDVIGYGVMRFISIDGGHTAEHTISDLRLAQDIVRNDGLVILDDVLNHHWLGVIEGACKFLQTQPTLLPVAIGHNKLFLCKLSHHQTYLDIFAKSSIQTKSVRFFGHEVAAL